MNPVLQGENCSLSAFCTGDTFGTLNFIGRRPEEASLEPVHSIEARSCARSIQARRQTNLEEKEPSASTPRAQILKRRILEDVRTKEDWYKGIQNTRDACSSSQSTRSCFSSSLGYQS